MRTAKRSAIALVLVVAACWLVPDAVPARLIFDPADPAFAGATVVPLTLSNLGLSNATPILTFSTLQNGVTFGFSTTAAAGMFPTGGGISGAPVLNTPRVGVVITISPPVAAIGFNFVLAECVGHAEFTGVAATEQFSTAFNQRNVFIGAADIGDISRVTLNDPCASAAWSEMRFVPSTGTPPPTGQADLALEKSVAPVGGPPSSPTGVFYTLEVTNHGPDPAAGAQVVDFLPPGHTLAAAFPATTLDPSGSVATTHLLSPLIAGASDTALLRVDEPPFGQGLFCESVTTNVALTTATTLDPDKSNNLDVAVKFFDRASRAGFPEICDNGIDDNCDGRVDCFDFSCGSAPNCAVPPGVMAALNCSLTGLTPVPGLALISLGAGCGLVNLGGQTPTATSCDVPVIRRDGTGRRNISIPAFCCDGPPPNPQEETLRRGQCSTSFNDQFNALPGPHNFILGGSVPIDPNFKTAVPTVNFLGYGYTEAGATITYQLHYENIGTGDAHDVSIVDVLHPDLDETTLLVTGTATFDPTNRALIWRDAVVPPATPRSVGFSARVRSTAAVGSSIVNVGTVVFPDAVPPSRVETNTVRHVITRPGQVIAPDLRVGRCQEATPGSGQWRVALLNEGFGFAYNVRATIVRAPASVHVTDGSVTSFRHPSDLPVSVGTVVPLAVTLSADTVAFTTQTLGDPCDTMLWRIQWQDGAGVEFTRDVQSAADTDGDGVANARDNCPTTFNPDQADRNGNGVGDACEARLVCDVDGNGQVDRNDINAIMAARNTTAAPGDPRDVSSVRGDGVPDGRITVDDARYCTLRCTKPQCAP